MSFSISAKRHAQALFEIGIEGNEVEQWQTDLDILVSKLKDADLLGVLENPKIHFADKANILDTVLVEVSPLAKNLAYLLTTKNRLRMLDIILVEYQRLMDSYYGREHIAITTAE